MPLRPLTCLLLFAFSALGAPTPAATFGIYRSTDDGRSWSQVGQGLPPDLRVDALGQIGDVRIAGTERGVYRSTDDGGTWSRPERGVPENLKVFEFATLGNRIYSGTARGVWVSADQGDTWEPVGTELAHVRILSLAVAEGRLYAGTDLQGVWRLREETAGWEDVRKGLPEDAQIFQFAGQNGSLYAALYSRGVYRFDAAHGQWIAAGDDRPLRLVSAGDVLFSGRNPGGIFTSRDGGAHWTEASVGLPHNAATWSLVSRGPTVLIGTSGHSGLLRTDDAGRHWTPSDQGLPLDGEAIAFGVGETSVLAVIISHPGRILNLGTSSGALPR